MYQNSSSLVSYESYEFMTFRFRNTSWLLSRNVHAQTIDCVSVYASHRHFHAHPLALLPGHAVQVDNVEKVTSGKGHVYFAANCMTRFTSLGPSAAVEDEEGQTGSEAVSFLRDVRDLEREVVAHTVFPAL